MEIRNLGGSGLRVSAVGLGCNNFGQRTDPETSRKVIHRALDRVSPLAVPVMLEIGREMVYGEASDALLAEAADELVKEAMQ